MLDNLSKQQEVLRRKIFRMVKENGIPIRRLAAKLGIDPSNLAKIISGQRGSVENLERIYQYLNCDMT